MKKTKIEVGDQVRIEITDDSYVNGVVLDMPDSPSDAWKIRDEGGSIQYIKKYWRILVMTIGELRKEDENECPKLRTCPFCGADAEVVECGDMMLLIECSECSLARTGKSKHLAPIVEEWNNRRGEDSSQ